MKEDTRNATAGAMSEINITPLIDVMLVLLIIFMVVTPTATKSLETSLPRDSSGGEIRRSDPLVLEVGNDGLRLNQTPLTGFAELGDKLREVLLARSDKTLFVRSSGSVRYAQVVLALDVARGAGAERIGIMGLQGEPAAN